MTFKQKSLHKASFVWSYATLLALVCVSCIASRSVVAQTPTSFEASSLHLIAAPGLKDGAYVAGIDISMAAGSHTYWKQPGDAGVPPVFVFTGSKNVATADVMFPAPSRISDDGLVSFGYADDVVFPVKVTPSDSAKSAVLHVDITYAVCNKICLPAHGEATLNLEPHGAGAERAILEAAVADVPKPVSAAERANLTIRPDKGAAKASWTLTWTGTPPLDDVFADAPEGFYFDTHRRGADSWSLVAAQSVGLPKGTTVPVSLILTRKGGTNLILTEKLDVAASTQ